jgi:hypothetical protein
MSEESSVSEELHGVWRQHPLETDLVRSCYCCGVAVGSLFAQLSALSPTTESPDCDDDDDDSSPVPPRTTLPCSPPCPTLTAGSSEIACPHGCGVPYCSTECIKADGRRGHRLLCVGGVETEAHPLFQFKVTAFDRGGPDTYMLLGLAAQCVAANLMEPGFFGVGDADLAPADAWSGACEDDAADSADLLLVTWGLLSEALRERATALNLPMLQEDHHTAEWWGKVVGTIHRHHVEVATPTAVIDYCKALTSTTSRAMLVAVEGMLCDLGLIRSQDEANTGPSEVSARKDVTAASDGYQASQGDGGGESEEEEDDMLLPSFQQLLSQPGQFLPERTGMAYFGKLAVLPHCCVPSVSVAFANTITPARKALQPDGARVFGECWSRVPSELTYSDRVEALDARGLACGCSRCSFEQSGTVATTTIVAAAAALGAQDTPCATGAAAEAEIVRRIALLAEDDGRNGDAVTAWARVVTLLPEDADARYHEARATGWADEWAESHRLLTRAAADFPKHIETIEALAARNCYTHIPPVGEPMTKELIAERFDTICVESADMGDTVSGEDVVYCSRAPLLDPHGCELAVAAVEAYIVQKGGWSTSRHYR